jgi:flagellar biosynthesis anti-sigma factor FlgM
MVGIQGIAGVPEPNKPDRSSGSRDQAKSGQTEDSTSSNSDGVEISSAAQAAAQIAQSLKLTENQSDIRADRVAAAKAAIERGDYKKPEIVEAVAQRIAKLL